MHYRLVVSVKLYLNLQYYIILLWQRDRERVWEAREYLVYARKAAELQQRVAAGLYEAGMTLALTGHMGHSKWLGFFRVPQDTSLIVVTSGKSLEGRTVTVGLAEEMTVKPGRKVTIIKYAETNQDGTHVDTEVEGALMPLDTWAGNQLSMNNTDTGPISLAEYASNSALSVSHSRWDRVIDPAIELEKLVVSFKAFKPQGRPDPYLLSTLRRQIDYVDPAQHNVTGQYLNGGNL